MEKQADIERKVKENGQETGDGLLMLMLKG